MGAGLCKEECELRAERLLAGVARGGVVVRGGRGGDELGAAVAEAVVKGAAVAGGHAGNVVGVAFAQLQGIRQDGRGQFFFLTNRVYICIIYL